MAINSRAKRQSAAWVGYPGPVSVLPSGTIHQSVRQQIGWSYFGIGASGGTAAVELYGTSDGTSTATAWLLVGSTSGGNVFRRTASGTPRAMVVSNGGTARVFTAGSSGTTRVFE